MLLNIHSFIVTIKKCSTVSVCYVKTLVKELLNLEGLEFTVTSMLIQMKSLMVDPLSYFLFQPVLHNWCNKHHGMYYTVCRMVHIKELLLLIGQSSP